MQIKVLRKLSSNNNNQYKKQEQETLLVKLSSESLEGEQKLCSFLKLRKHQGMVYEIERQRKR